jgi:hypothetical protein
MPRFTIWAQYEPRCELQLRCSPTLRLPAQRRGAAPARAQATLLPPRAEAHTPHSAPPPPNVVLIADLARPSAPQRPPCRSAESAARTLLMKRLHAQRERLCCCCSYYHQSNQLAAGILTATSARTSTPETRQHAETISKQNGLCMLASISSASACDAV